LGANTPWKRVRLTRGLGSERGQPRGPERGLRRFRPGSARRSHSPQHHQAPGGDSKGEIRGGPPGRNRRTRRWPSSPCRFMIGKARGRPASGYGTAVQVSVFGWCLRWVERSRERCWINCSFESQLDKTVCLAPLRV
jgi:hypothetical protein